MIGITQTAVEGLAFDAFNRHPGLLGQIDNFSDNTAFLHTLRDIQTVEYATAGAKRLAYRVAPV